MSVLEDRAAPVVADMISGQHDVQLDVDTKQAIAEWALAASIVRGEVTTEVRPIDRDFAQRFRADGLDGLPVLALAVNVERTREASVTGPVASSYVHDVAGGAPGHLVLFWLDRVVFLVATEMFAGFVSERLGVIRQAVTLMSPAETQETWPPVGSVTDSALLRALPMRFDELPRQSFDWSRLRRGRQTIDAYILPNTNESGSFRDGLNEDTARIVADALRPDSPID